jgi:hypothetical protein
MKFNELSQELQELWTRGVDHSVFNEDWAKMGGVVFHENIGPLKLLYDDVSRNYVFCEVLLFGDTLIPDKDILNMATTEQCAAAGIDYVPFMGWRDIDSAPLDETSVLLSTESEGTVIGWRREYRIGLEKLHAFASYSVMGSCEGGDGGCDCEPFDAKKWMPLPLV